MYRRYTCKLSSHLAHKCTE